MNRTKNVCLIAGAALSLGGVAMAQNSTDLERAYAAELMADATTRTSELAQGGGFTADVHGYFQFRYNWNRRDSHPSRAEDNTIGFQNARTRVNVSGNVGNEDWSYFIQFGAGPDGSFFLEDVYGVYRFQEGWDVTFGQFKVPFSREQLMGDTYLLAADRSASNGNFSGGRTQGVQLGYGDDQMRFKAAFTDGALESNTDFNMNNADFSLTARGEFKWQGDWEQARDFTSFPNSDPFGMVGVAAHWQSGGNTVMGDTGVTDDYDLWAITADVSVEGNGWNAFGAVYYTSLDVSGSPTFTDLGFLVQGGIFVSEQTELFGRWDAVIPDSDWAPADKDFHTITVGVNHYFIPDSHAVKFTADFQWFLEATENSIVSPDTLTGLLVDPEDNQWNIRGQLQILF